jgi:hypothetical protein
MNRSSPYRFGRLGMAVVLLTLPLSLPSLAICRFVYCGAAAAFETIALELAELASAFRFVVGKGSSK